MHTDEWNMILDVRGPVPCSYYYSIPNLPYRLRLAQRCYQAPGNEASLRQLFYSGLEGNSQQGINILSESHFQT